MSGTSGAEVANVSFDHKGNEDDIDGEWPHYNFMKLTTGFLYSYRPPDS